MAVDTALYPSALNTTLPTASDFVSEGDDNLRQIKTCLKTTFPNFGGAFNATQTEANYLVGVTSAIQTQLNAKAPTAGPTFTGTVVLPATTSIGTVSDAEIAHLDGVTSAIQTQINAKGAITGQAWTGAHDYTGGTLRAATLAAGTSTTEVATTAHVASVAFSAVLPGQSGNAGKFVTTDGTDASWSDTLAGNLSFSGSARRITGDFSNATIANQLAFQTTTANNNTRVGILPNGTGNIARVAVVNNSDPTNSSEVSLAATSTDTRIESSLRGSGSYLPFTTYVGGFKNTEQPIAGGLLVTSAAGLGYGAGAGGTVTQATSKSTSVTLNKPCGLITMNNAALAAGGTALFTFSNSLIGEGDVLFLQLDSTGIASTADYNVWSSGGAGAAVVALKNISAGSLSEAVRLRFVLVKGSQS